AWQHVRWQAFTELTPQIVRQLEVRCLISRHQTYERGYRLSGAALDHRNYDCIAYSRQTAQIRFNVAKLNAVPAELDLFIHASFEKQQSVTEAAAVAGLVRT